MVVRAAPPRRSGPLSLLLLSLLLVACTRPQLTWLSPSPQKPAALGRRSAALVLTEAVAVASPARAATSVDGARQQLQDAQKALDELLADYDSIKKKKSGDVVRNSLKASSSPVAQVPAML